mmetsp:Transcript_20867/g.23243  ORF Transcript_20867/g.23243 Transcript_20867/m.23243 type:complete len:135 (+) Transcript_20867:33-437(+)
MSAKQKPRSNSRRKKPRRRSKGSNSKTKYQTTAPKQPSRWAAGPFEISPDASRLPAPSFASQVSTPVKHTKTTRLPLTDTQPQRAIPRTLPQRTQRILSAPSSPMRYNYNSGVNYNYPYYQPVQYTNYPLLVQS